MINNCRIRNFRILTDKKIQFDPNLTVISGPNGSGKTSILEAIYFAGCGRSFRTRNVQQLIMFSKQWFRVEIDTDNGHLDARYRKPEKQKEIFLNEEKGKIAAISTQFPFFILNQKSLDVVRAGRKNAYLFFNKVLSRLFPSYIQALSAYRTALNNKRLLLKKMVRNDMIQAWNRVLEEHRMKLTKQRKWLISVLNKLLPEGVEIQYLPSQPDKSLDSFLLVEQEKQIVLAGSHLDRYRFLRQGKDVREFSSSGQQKKVFFDVITTVGHLFHQQRGIKPVLLLDDFDSEFDKTNMVRNLDLVMGQFQVVLTTTDRQRFSRFQHELVQLKSEERGITE